MNYTLTLTEWYAVALGSAFSATIIWSARPFLQFFFIWGRFLTLSYGHHLLFLKRRYWSSVTILEAAILAAYIISNGVLMGLGIHNIVDLMRRCGSLASINMIPLFMGGRTSFLADSLGIPLHTYYFAHHWIGRVVVVQGLLHSILILVMGKIILSGIVVSASLTLLFLSSFYFVRRFMFETFLKLHLLLAMIIPGALIWHLLPGSFLRVLFPTLALSLWALNAVFRFSRILLYNFKNGSFGQEAIVSQVVGGAIKIEIQLKTPFHIPPGKHVYLCLPGLRAFQAHPFIITWWNEESVKEKGDVPTSTKTPQKGPFKAKSVSFLIQPQEGLTRRLSRQNSVRVVFDGPYGQDLQLDNYENVMLVAQGIGIAGILPYARHLSNRRFHEDPVYQRGLATRKVDIFWVLEENSQECWVSEYLLQLQLKDKDRSLLQIWCYYPGRMISKPPIILDDHYQCFYPGTNPPYSIPSAIKMEAAKSPGKNIVVACGAPAFTDSIRSSVFKISSKDNILEFVDVEYRPCSNLYQEFRSGCLGEQNKTELEAVYQGMVKQQSLSGSLQRLENGKGRASLYNEKHSRLSRASTLAESYNEKHSRLPTGTLVEPVGMV